MHAMLIGITSNYLLLNRHINADFFFILDLFLGCYDENPIREITFAKLQADNTANQATKCLHI